jgi:predicted aminopeptidase
VEEVAADPATAAPLAGRLRTAARMRRFAVEELALPDNGSYRRYAHLERTAVLWAVAAAPALSVEPRQWCFPVAGCVSYRGYFRPDAAQAFAAGLAAEGWDVVVQPAAAYSTLGWLADPLPSTVIDWPRPRLAGLLFHELAHQRLYVPGDTAFNEAFARVVETAGVRRWLAVHGRPGERQAWERLQARRDRLNRLVLEARRELQTLYGGELPEELKLRRKERLLKGLGEDVAALGWAQEAIPAGAPNNAWLAMVQAYEGWVPALSALLERQGRSLPAFYRACDELAGLGRAEREVRLRALRPATTSVSAAQHREPRALTAAPEMQRRHRIQIGGLDAQGFQPVLPADAVHLQGEVVVVGEGLARHALEDARLQPRGEVGQADDALAHSELPGGVLHQLAQAEHPGAAQLVVPAVGPAVLEAAQHRLGHVADVHRSETALGAGQGEGPGSQPQQGREAVQEPVARAEDDRRAEAGHGHAGPAQGVGPVLALALGPEIEAGALRLVGVEGAHVEKPVDARGPAGIDEAVHELHVDLPEAAVAALVEDAHQIHHRLAALHQPGQALRVPQIGLYHRDQGQGREPGVALGPTAGHDRADAGPLQPDAQMAADKTGAAENADSANLHVVVLAF